LGTAVGAALSNSRVRRLATASLHEPDEIVRLAGVALATASVTHAVLVRLLPSLTVGDVPVASSLAALAIGVTASVVPRHLAAAWSSSLLRRASHRLVTAVISRADDGERTSAMR
jgi:hypothetical protein